MSTFNKKYSVIKLYLNITNYRQGLTRAEFLEDDEEDTQVG